MRVQLRVLETPRPRTDSLHMATERFFGWRESQFRYCYAEHGLRRDSTVTGVAVVTVTLDRYRIPTVIHVRALPGSWRPVDRATPHAVVRDSVAGCLRLLLRRWRWPRTAPSGRYSVLVEFTRDSLAGLLRPPAAARPAPVRAP